VKHSLLTWLIVSALAGLVAPFGWLMTLKLTPGQEQLGGHTAYLIERIVRVIWPSSFWLMATDGIEGTPKAYFFICLSVAANVILYAIVGAVLFGLMHIMRITKWSR
jgi:hypothetical protein